ncbi:MAG: putative MFS family arabinose efflux permease [Candidatus Midichloriaceae bacterium]|jgi:predicted MFS family arabinose efflux permease
MYPAFVAWNTWLVLVMFYAYQLILRITPNVVMQQIMDNFKVDADMVGNFAGIYYVGYVLMHIPLAIILDHYSPRKVITACIASTVIGFMPLIYSDNWMLITVGRFISGMGAAGAALGAFKMLRVCFGEERFPKMLGYMVSIGLLGAMFGSGPVTYFISIFGWTNTLNFMVYFGIVLCIYSFFSIPKLSSNEDGLSIKVILGDLKLIATNKYLWILSIMGGFMIGPMEGFADAWSNQYLKSVYEFNDETAGSATQMIYLGMAVGLVSLGYLFEKFKTYYGLILLSAFGMGLAMTLVIFGIGNLILLKFLFFVIGFFCGYQLIVIAKAATFASEKHATLTSTVANMIMMSFGYVFHRSMGKVMLYTCDIDLKGVITYTKSSYNYAMSTIVIGLVIGMVICVFLMYFDRKSKKIA